MSETKLLNSQVDQWMKDNPRKENEAGYYMRVASKFTIHPEKARKRWRMLSAKSNPTKPNVKGAVTTDSLIGGYTWNPNSSCITTSTEEQIKTLEDLIKICKIDTDKFNVLDFDVKSYNAWIKNKEGEIEKKPLYSVKAHLKERKVETDLQKQRDLFIAEMIKHAPKYKAPQVDLSPIVSLNVQERQVRNHALEINIPDLHIGKLAWGKETGEDYDSNIAIERYKTAVRDLISRVNPHILEKIILPVGNDLLQVDNSQNTTTAGTHVSTDSRFGKMFQTAKALLIDTIDKLSSLAPVEVIIIPGNHDSIATFTLGEVLDAWYNKNDRVTVINTHTPRKYVKYGQNLIMYTHGHREKLEQLGIICATEQPQLWADTKYRRVHVGHFHHTKQIKFVDVHEQPGFTIRILNSLSSNDAWHAEKGYLSLKGAEAFLYDKDKGLVANYFYLND